MTGMSCYVFTLTNKHNCCSFSNDDGDGSKHVTMKMNSNLYIVDAFIPTRFKCWSLIQSSKRGENVFLCLLPPTSHKEFHVIFVQLRQRNEQKSVQHVRNYCFAY